VSRAEAPASAFLTVQASQPTAGWGASRPAFRLGWCEAPLVVCLQIEYCPSMWRGPLGLLCRESSRHLWSSRNVALTGDAAGQRPRHVNVEHLGRRPPAVWVRDKTSGLLKFAKSVPCQN
jgi:hypothetical protein